MRLPVLGGLFWLIASIAMYTQGRTVEMEAAMVCTQVWFAALWVAAALNKKENPFEIEVLEAVAWLSHCKVEPYGVPIAERLKQVLGKPPMSGKLYTTLDRLERKGLLTAEMKPRQTGGARDMRVYSITKAAAERLMK